MHALKYIAHAVLLTLVETAFAQGVTALDARSSVLSKVAAEPVASVVPLSVDFKQYLNLVQKNNLALAAQKSQIDIADAQIALAA